MIYIDLFMETDPLISVTICTYNGEKYLKETLESIYGQTYRNLEILIVDDGSTDGTRCILEEALLADNRVRVFYQENQGFGAARNKCVELASSDYIAIIDQDDICLPDRVEAQVNSAKKYPRAAMFFSNSEHFLDDGGIIRRQFDCFDIDPCTMKLSSGSAAENLLLHGCFIDSETVLFRKDAAIEVGGFNSAYKYMVDYEFFLRIGEKYDIICDSQVLARWRVHPGQASHTMRETIYLETMDVLKKWVCKPVPAEIKTAIRLQLWFCLVRYGLFLAGLGRFRESRKCIVESFSKRLRLDDTIEYLVRKVRRRFVRKYRE